ncbi:MAG: ABC transporter permease [Eubacterium sp.]|nr:ABC transporter permease [Eubacterium sp.]
MSIIDKAKQYRFLFEELTKRDFKKKYKRAVLGIAWSVLSPFMNFLVYLFVFSYLFQHNMEHFPIYIMTGSLMFSFFSTATNAGMFSMYSNSGVMSKIKVPKTIFLLSSNVASIFNFLLTMIVYFIFVAIDGLPFGPHMLLILYPLVCLTVFNIGMGYILSSLFVFFRDTQYLYGIFTQLLTFLSAIFYTVDRFPEDVQIVFAINPVYRYITYVRQVVIDGTIPDLSSHLFCLVAAVAVFALGYFIHRKTEQKFVYYF